MKNNGFRLVSIASTMALIASLAACGGGGGSDSTGSGSGSGNGSGGGSVPPPPSNAVPTTGTLQTSAPVPTYTPGGDQLAAYTALNSARLSAGAGVLVQSTLIDTAAGAHATYLGDNFASVGASHTEQPGLPAYYADTPQDRLAKAGYNGPASEVLTVINSTTQATGADCVSLLLTTVYHLSVMMGTQTQVGVGTNATTAFGMPLQSCVIDMSVTTSNTFGQIPASGSVVGYPYANETNVPSSWQPGGEVPRVPVALVPALVAGTPIAISLDNADYENLAAAGMLNPTLTTFTLTDAAGNLVPASIVAYPAIHGSTNVTVNADTTGDIVKGSAVMIPLAALNANAMYTVTVAATLSTGGTPLTKTWTFTTAAN